LDRQIIYPGQVPLETDLLSTNRNILVALGKLAAATVGTATVANGLACTQTTVPSLAVSVAAGEIYSLQNLDGTAYSSLALDTTHQIVKQGIMLDAQTLSTPAPGTAGQSVVYLIEATYQDVDATSVVLPYYNSSNPTLGYSGPGGSGTSQYTQRLGKVILQAKAGTPAATGSQVAPSADANYIGLWTVTVANGAASVVNANIALATSAPFLTSLAAHIAAANPHPQYPLLTAFGNTLASIGTQTLPGGLIMKWGIDTTDHAVPNGSAPTQVTVTFATAFPTACLNVQMTARNPANDYVADCWPELASMAAGSFVMQGQSSNPSGGTLHGFLWLAFGY
jgi:hypothetical protein